MDSDKLIFHEIARGCFDDHLRTAIANVLPEGENAEREPYYVSPLAYLNQRDHHKYTPLHTAIFCRNLEAVKAFLELGIDVNTKCHGTPSTHLCVSTAALPEGYDFGAAALAHLLGPLKPDREPLDLTAKDDHGFTVLHLACEYDFLDIARQSLKATSGGELLESRDRLSNRPLHACALHDSIDTAKHLLECGALVGSKNAYGATPLHVAASVGSASMWTLLIDHHASVTERDNFGRTPLDMLSRHGYQVDKSGKNISRVGQKGSVKTSIVPTAIVTSSMCSKHYTCTPSETDTPSAPPENLRRIHVLTHQTEGSLRAKGTGDRLHWIEECRAAAISDVLRVHEWPYIRVLQSKVEALPSDPEVDGGIGSLDGDTTISRHTYDAASKAAGAVCQAIDMVMSGDVVNAFCPVRPPGHHAGPKGLVKTDGGPDSHGFCFFNNVSIGAAYAMNVHRDKVKRVAIVDFDVHNGNGTAETVRWLKPHLEEETLLSPYAFGAFHHPRYKPWFDNDDAKNVMFVSVHGYGPRERGLEHLMPAVAFYPGSGQTYIPDLSEFGDDKTSIEIDSPIDSRRDEVPSTRGKTDDDVKDFMVDGDGDGDGDDDDDGDGDFNPDGDSSNEDEEDSSISIPGVNPSNERLVELKEVFQRNCLEAEETLPTLILNVGVALPEPDDPVGAYRHQWRNYFRKDIFPRLLTFNPDLIIISAGFDAHKRDEINGGYISLIEEDFEWVTNGLVKIANSCCQGRIVSSLEGGYQIAGEHSSAFAKSVKIHVNALMRGASCPAVYDQEEMDKEIELEMKTIQEAETRRLAKIDALNKRREEAIAERRKEYESSIANEISQANSADVEATPSKKRSRRTAQQVDYVELAKQMADEEAN